MIDQSLGATPFLRERRRDELAETYSREIREGNRAVPHKDAWRIAQQLAELAGPLDEAVLAGKIPRFELTTEIGGLTVKATGGEI